MTEKHTTKIRRVKQEWQPQAWIDINGNSFAHPSLTGNYASVGSQINNTANLSFATGDQIADLLYSAYCDKSERNSEEMQHIRKTMKNRWIWVGNRNLWTSDGVYVIQDSQGIGRSQELAINELESALKGGKEFSWGGVRVSQDKRIRFAPKDTYSLGYQSPEDFAKNGFVIASCNQEGSEKLAKVSQAIQFKTNSYIWGLNISEGQAPIQRLSAVVDYYGRLFLSGHNWGDSDVGCAFGVLNSDKK